jgi:hypothetical protein
MKTTCSYFSWVKALCSYLGFCLFISLPEIASGQYQMENLDRGTVAVRSGNNNFISWRWLGTEDNISFNLYRNGLKVNSSPLSTTNYTDIGAAANASYSVRAIVNGVEQAASAAVTPWAQQYLRVPIEAPPSGTTPTGESYSYTANDASVADLDGDGQWEIILKWDPTNSKDNSQSGYTGNVYIDAYKLNGTRLWRINLGRNIRAGAHYTQFMVYDFDSDGKAEMMCKTSDGTIDGKGTVIGNANADHRNSSGYILSGPEFLTVFNGQTGAAMATVNYVPARGTVSSWGDNYGNRVDRFRAGVAYLDGKTPSAIFCRGYYTRMVIAAFDWKNNQLTTRWVFDSGTSSSNAYYGQGNHSLSIADVDGDGKHEIISGSAIIDDNGTGYYSTRFGHGDAGHVSDLDPDLPGMEVFNIQEPVSNAGCYMYSAKEKRVLWQKPTASGSSEGPGRGVCADISSSIKGAESWVAGGGISGVFDCKGNLTGLATPPSCNFLVWWDGDLQRELLDKTQIDKYGTGRLLSAHNIVPVASNNGTKSTPALSADLVGDWREEVIWRSSANDALYIFTTTIPSPYKFRTLMHDPQYRTAIAWQNTAYNQPPHLSYYLGGEMPEPPKPNIVIVGGNKSPNVAITSPANNATFTAPASVNISANASDPDGTISNLQFYNGTVLLGSDASAPYNFTWSNVAAGTYIIVVRATDNAGATSESSVNITVNPAPPQQTIFQGETACSVDGVLNESVNAGFHGTGYLNTNNAMGTAAEWAINSTIVQSVNLSIRYANASSTSRNMSLSINGTTQITSVGFPSTGAWTTWNITTVQVSLVSGTNRIRLQSLTSEGGPNIDELIFSSTSVSAGNCVNTPTNLAPTVSITSPANNASYTAPANIAIAANASDPDGTISNVQFYNGSVLLGSDVTAPYNFNWSNVPAGSYTITARATDNSGAITTSSPVSITVNPPANVSPSVNITSPSNNSSFTAPASITITANASDPDGSISNVQFYNGTTLLGSDNSAPYSFTWNNVSAGSYTLIARATDNNGAVSSSASVNITIQSSQPEGDILGPDCGLPNSLISFEVNFSKRNGATAYSWWFQGYTQSITPVSGSPYKVEIQSGQHFTGGQVCVGVSYNIAPYYATYCKSIDLCSSNLKTGLAADESALSISPNPSAGAFIITAEEEITSLKVVNELGVVVYQTDGLEEERISFGEQIREGLYVVYIQYSSGKTEIRRIQKVD